MVQLRSAKGLNIYGVSAFTISIYNSIVATMYANIATNVAHCLLLLTGYLLDMEETNTETERTFILVLMAIVTMFFQLRSLFSAYTDLNIMFEFISLLHMIWLEQGRQVGHILYLAAVADSSVLEKRRLIRREKAI